MTRSLRSYLRLFAFSLACVAGAAAVSFAGSRARPVTIRIYDLAQRTVRRAAAQARTDADVLLGRAVAHEVGHLLLRSRTHSDRGLMREVWADGELFRNRTEDWLFSSRERAGLQQRTGLAGTVASK